MLHKASNSLHEQYHGLACVSVRSGAPGADPPRRERRGVVAAPDNEVVASRRVPRRCRGWRSAVERWRGRGAWGRCASAVAVSSAVAAAALSTHPPPPCVTPAPPPLPPPPAATTAACPDRTAGTGRRPSARRPPAETAAASAPRAWPLRDLHRCSQSPAWTGGRLGARCASHLGSRRRAAEEQVVGRGGVASALAALSRPRSPSRWSAGTRPRRPRPAPRRSVGWVAQHVAIGNVRKQ